MYFSLIRKQNSDFGYFNHMPLNLINTADKKRLIDDRGGRKRDNTNKLCPGNNMAKRKKLMFQNITST